MFFVNAPDVTVADSPFTVTCAALVVPLTVSVSTLVNKSVIGDNTSSVSAPAVEEYVTLRVSVVLFPAASVASTVIMFSPCGKVSDFSKLSEVEPAAETPFTVTDAEASFVPFTVILGAFTIEPSEGDVMESDGKILSNVMGAVASMEFPAASEAVTFTLFAPSMRFAVME